MEAAGAGRDDLDIAYADNTMITGPGGAPKWRLHSTCDLVAARFTGLELTDERGAEGFGRTAAGRGLAQPPQALDEFKAFSTATKGWPASYLFRGSSAHRASVSRACSEHGCANRSS